MGTIHCWSQYCEFQKEAPCGLPFPVPSQGLPQVDSNRKLTARVWEKEFSALSPALWNTGSARVGLMLRKAGKPPPEGKGHVFTSISLPDS